MHCIYCLRPSGDSAQKAHVFPEAIAPKGPVLPIGVECDACNLYVGTKLETMLVRHPLIAIPLQLAGIPGKSGKPRKKLGIFEREVEPGWTLTFPVEPSDPYYGPDGVQRCQITPAVDPLLDYAKFSRALHHIAFNLFAYKHGVDAALSGEFDPVRQFIRAPRNRQERWPYVELCEQLTNFDGVCRGSVKNSGWICLANLHLYNVEYYVDLLNRGKLLTTRIQSLPGAPAAVSAQLVGPGFVPPEPKPLDVTPDGKVRHHRVSIE